MDNEIWSDAEDEWLSDGADAIDADATLAELRDRLSNPVVIEVLGDDDIPF